MFQTSAPAAKNATEILKRVIALLYTLHIVPKIVVLPKRMTKPVELDGTLEKTENGLIAKDVYGRVIGHFDADCQWWLPEPPEAPQEIRRLSATELETYERVAMAVRTGKLTEEQCARIMAVLSPDAGQ